MKLGNYITDSGLAALADNFESVIDLELFFINSKAVERKLDNKITDRGIMALADNLKYSFNLKELNLSRK